MVSKNLSILKRSVENRQQPRLLRQTDAEIKRRKNRKRYGSTFEEALVRSLFDFLHQSITGNCIFVKKRLSGTVQMEKCSLKEKKKKEKRVV